MALLLKLHDAIAAVAPIDGVEVPNVAAPSAGDVTIAFKPEATDQQKTDAAAVLAAFDFIDRTAKLNEVSASAAVVLAAGWHYATEDGAGTFTFAADAASLSRWTAIFAAAQANLLKYPVAVQTADNQVAQLSSLADVTGWFSAAMDLVTSVSQASAQLASQVQAAPDRAALDSTPTDVASAVVSPVVPLPPAPGPLPVVR